VCAGRPEPREGVCPTFADLCKDLNGVCSSGAIVLRRVPAPRNGLFSLEHVVLCHVVVGISVPAYREGAGHRAGDRLSHSLSRIPIECVSLGNLVWGWRGMG